MREESGRGQSPTDGCSPEDPSIRPTPRLSGQVPGSFLPTLQPSFGGGFSSFFEKGISQKTYFLPLPDDTPAVRDEQGL